MNLLTKLTVILFSFALVLMLVFGYSFFSLTQSFFHESAFQNQSELAQKTILKIDEKMYERSLDIQNYSSFFVPEEITSGEFNQEKEQKRIEDFLENSSMWNTLSVVDSKTGTFLISTLEEEIGVDVNNDLDNKEAYEKALYGEFFVSDVFLDKTGKPVVLFSAPIESRNEDEQYAVGVVLGRMNWSIIEEVVKSNEELTKHIHLFSKDKIMIATNDNQKDLFNKSFEDFFDGTFFENKVVSSVMENNEQTFEALVSFSSQNGYLNYKGNEWILVIETPTSVSFVPSHDNTFNVLKSIFPVVFCIVLFLLLVINRVIIRPIKELTKTTEKIASGDMAQRANVKSKDEIGYLSQSFNRMTDSLVSASDYIENIIKTMPMSLIVIDGKGKIKKVNESTLRMLGYKKEELLEKDINIIFSPSNDPKETKNTEELLKELKLDNIFQNKHLENVRTHFKSKSGEQIHVDLSVGLLSEKEKDSKNKEQVSSVIFIAKDLRELTYYAYKRLNKITPVLKKIAVGDFSENVEIPKEEDEFTEHMVAIKLTIENFRKMFEEIQKNSEDLKIHNEKLKEISEELEKSKTELEIKVSERTQELEKSKTELEIKVSERTSQLFDLNKNLEDEVQKRTTELKTKLLELKKFNKIAVGRELRMIELKEEMERLKEVIAAFEKSGQS